MPSKRKLYCRCTLDWPLAKFKEMVGLRLFEHYNFILGTDGEDSHQCEKCGSGKWYLLKKGTYNKWVRALQLMYEEWPQTHPDYWKKGE